MTQRLTGAVNQELGRIAGVQHHEWGIRNPSGQKSVFDKPMEFKPWLLAGMNHFYERDGTEFQVIVPGLMRIVPKNRKPFLRTLEDFKREYEEYKVNYYL